MTAATYAIAAAIVALLATRAWLADRTDHAHRVFLALGWSLALAWMSFALSLLPGLDSARAGWTFASPIAAACTFHAYGLLFSPRAPNPATGRTLIGLSTLLGLVGSLAHAVGYGLIPRASPPEVVVGVWVLCLACAAQIRLFRAHARSRRASEKTRIRWLLGTSCAGMVLAFAEWAARTLDPVYDPNALSFLERGLTLQGMLPPASTVLFTLSVYFVFHAIERQRLLDLQTMFAHTLVAMFGGAVLLAANSLALTTVALTRFPFHSSFLLFLLAAAWLLAYDRVHRRVLDWTMRALRAPGHALDDALPMLLRTLAGADTPAALCSELAHLLVSTERFASVGIWRREDERGRFVCESLHGTLAIPRVVADDLDLDTLPLEASDALFPLQAGDLTLGWITVRDAAWSDGLTRTETDKLDRIAQITARLLGSFTRLSRRAEDQRLASLGSMAAGLAHEIRNPLAGLKGAAQLLADANVSDDDREMLDIISLETDRLNRVVQDFLSYARPTKPARTTVRLEDTLAHLTALLAAEGLADQRTFAQTLDPSVTTLHCDPDGLMQILLNLVRNAIEATPPGGRIEIRAQRVRNGVVIEICDDGPGFPPELLNQPFTPFFTTKPTGTGLGLAISRRIAREHCGDLLLGRTPDGQTLAALHLPDACAD